MKHDTTVRISACALILAASPALSQDYYIGTMLEYSNQSSSFRAASTKQAIGTILAGLSYDVSPKVFVGGELEYGVAFGVPSGVGYETVTRLRGLVGYRFNDRISAFATYGGSRAVFQNTPVRNLNGTHFSLGANYGLNDNFDLRFEVMRELLTDGSLKQVKSTSLRAGAIYKF